MNDDGPQSFDLLARVAERGGLAKACRGGSRGIRHPRGAGVRTLEFLPPARDRDSSAFASGFRVGSQDRVCSSITREHRALRLRVARASRRATERQRCCVSARSPSRWTRPTSIDGLRISRDRRVAHRQSSASSARPMPRQIRSRSIFRPPRATWVRPIAARIELGTRRRRKRASHGWSRRTWRRRLLRGGEMGRRSWAIRADATSC